jgi:hypothetical protein
VGGIRLESGIDTIEIAGMEGWLPEKTGVRWWTNGWRKMKRLYRNESSIL